MLKKTTRGMTAAMTRRGVGFATGGGGPSYDTDAQAYITLVEAADSQSLETGVKDAINAFVVGCKSDGIWDAIKAACIMAGARTLDGALVPLVGTAPANNNFVSGDYNRKTGLVGDGATKYLDSNRANNADPQDNQHACVYGNISRTSTEVFVGAGGTLTGRLAIFSTPSNLTFASRSSANSGAIANAGTGIGLCGVTRSSSANYIARGNGNNTTITQASETPTADDIFVFCRNSGTDTPVVFTANRLSFYSIGEALDLALLDTRVSTLMTAIGAAIP